MMGLVAVNGVLGKGTLAPCVCSTYAVNIGINIQIDETAALDVVGMMSAFKVFLAIVPGTDAEGLTTMNVDGCLFVGNLKEAHVTTVAIILWVDILCFEFV